MASIGTARNLASVEWFRWQPAAGAFAGRPAALIPRADPATAGRGKCLRETMLGGIDAMSKGFL